MGYITTAIIALAAIWLFLCAPSSKRGRASKYSGVKFAHRGLHSDDCAENSLKAFDRACEGGYGIELDVQFTSDKELVVFHDDNAVRMTGRDELIRNMSSDKVRELTLRTDGSSIPSFAEVLGIVNGRVPLLVEIKTCPNIKALARAVADALREYKGSYIVESFDPICIAELRRYAPEMIRGQLVTGRKDYRGQHGIVAFALSQLMINILARPDFIAYNAGVTCTAGLWLHKHIFRTPLAAWTITDAEQARRLSDKGIMPIFEKCRP